jgi:hypothetical protein
LRDAGRPGRASHNYYASQKTVTYGRGKQHLLLKGLDAIGLAQLEELTKELFPYARRIQIQDS